MNSPLRKDELLRRDEDQIRDPERIEREHDRIQRQLSSEDPRPVAVPEEDYNNPTRSAVSERSGPQSPENAELRRNPVSIDAGRIREQDTQEQELAREGTQAGNPDSLGEFQVRWSELQTIFVDDPRSAVQRADEVVSQSIQKIYERMNTQRSQLSERWQRNDSTSTEDLRVAFQNYRNFFRSLAGIQLK